MKKYIDLTITLDNQMPVYPGDNPFTLKTRKTINEDGYNDQTLQASMHVGTHIDAPNHMLESKLMVKDYDLNHLIGKGVIISAHNVKTINLTDDIKALDLNSKMVLIDTDHQALDYTNYPLLSEELVDYFIAQEVQALLLDTPSPDGVPFTIHKKLLSKAIPIVENVININKLKGYSGFNIFVIPLKINASGAYTRVFAEIDVTED